MIVWLASYPRSGNTFIRIVIDRVFGCGSTTVYSVDGVRERLGDGLFAIDGSHCSLEEARESSDVHFVKTHRRREYDAQNVDHAIYLVRDGRDATVSFARQRTEDDPSRYRYELRSILERHDGGTAGWGQNVLSWLPVNGSTARPRVAVVHFEELIVDPIRVVTDAVSRVVPDLQPQQQPTIPTFEQLQDVDPQFFRRGIPGTHRDEMPEDLEELFWSSADNRSAMRRAGYGSVARCGSSGSADGI